MKYAEVHRNITDKELLLKQYGLEAISHATSAEYHACYAAATHHMRTIFILTLPQRTMVNKNSN
jgi:hypothetical protein